MASPRTLQDDEEAECHGWPKHGYQPVLQREMRNRGGESRGVAPEEQDRHKLIISIQGKKGNTKSGHWLPIKSFRFYAFVPMSLLAGRLVADLSLREVSN